MSLNLGRDEPDHAASTDQLLELLTAVTDGTPDALFVKDVSGQYLFCNSAAISLANRPREKILKHDDTAVFGPAAAHAMRRQDQRVMLSGVAETETHCIGNEDDLRQILVTTKPYTDRQGTLQGVIVIAQFLAKTVMRDGQPVETNPAGHDHERARSEHALRESERQLADAQRIARIGSWGWEPSTGKVWWSRAVFELFGVDPQVVQPSFDAFLELLHPDDRGTAVARVEAMLAGAKRFEDELRIIRPDGQMVWLHSQAVATRDSHGRILRVEGTDQDITARKLAEERAQLSQRFANAVAESSPLTIYVFDSEKRQIIYSNFYCMHGLGYSREMFEDWSWPQLESLIHPDDFAGMAVLLGRWETAVDGQILELEYRLRDAEGNWRWFISRDTVFERTADGRVRQIIGTAEDITLRKQAEQALRDSEERFRSVLDHYPAAVFIKDLEGRYLFTNQHAAVATQIPQTDWVGKTARDFFPEEVAARFERNDQLVASTLRPHQLEEEVALPTGESITLLTVQFPLFRNEGQLYAVCGISTDITARVRAEEARLEIEERYRLATLATNDLIWDFDPATGAVGWNEHYGAVLGRQPGTNDSWEWWIERIHPNDRDRTVRILRAAVEGTDSHWTAEYQLLRADGTWASIQDRAYISRDSTGRARRVVGAMQDVTLRKQAESDLRKMTELLRAVAEGTSDAVYVKDHDGKYLLANRAACDFIGKPLDQVLGQDDTVLFDAESARLLREIDLAVMHSGRENTTEETLTADGITRTFFSTKSPHRDESGRVIGVIGISRDITGRKDAERMLRLNQFSVDHAVDSVFWVNSASEILYVNAAACRTLGYSRDEMVGKTVPDIDPNFPREAWPAHWEELQRRKSFTFESDHATKDGRMIKTEVSVNYLQYEGQEYNCAIMRDITERKAAEQELRQSLSRLQATLESTADGIVVVDLDGRIVDYNQRFLSIWNFPAELIAEARKSNIIETFNEHQVAQDMLAQLKDLEGFVRRVREMFLDREKTSFDVLEFKDGRVVERFSQPQWIDGRPVGRVLSFRDVSERRQLEEQLRQSQKMEAVGQLAGGIAHDFNNLLTVINGYCDVLLAQKAADQYTLESVQEIRDAGSRAAQLTEQLLAFSRRSQFQPRVVRLNDVIAGSERLLQRLIGEHVALAVQLDPNLPAIKADTIQIEQVLINLAVNARDAMPAGGSLTIRTSLVSPQDASQFQMQEATEAALIQLDITDTGVGMTSEIQARIFEPFFTTKVTGKGSGLGLSVVHGIMQQHKGQIRVITQPGKGTTFQLQFPSVAEVPLPAKAVAPQQARRGTETILLVEDEPGVRKLTRRILETQGFRVWEAADGQAALELARKLSAPIDLLVTDVVMPGISGRELADELRAIYRDLQVIYLSGYPKEFGVRDTPFKRHEAFLKKPFSQEDLLLQVRQSITQVS